MASQPKPPPRLRGVLAQRPAPRLASCEKTRLPKRVAQHLPPLKPKAPPCAPPASWPRPPRSKRLRYRAPCRLRATTRRRFRAASIAQPAPRQRPPSKSNPRRPPLQSVERSDDGGAPCLRSACPRCDVPPRSSHEIRDPVHSS